MTFLLGVGIGSLITIGFAFLVTSGDDDVDNLTN
jgi:hypothetical protein